MLLLSLKGGSNCFNLMLRLSLKGEHRVLMITESTNTGYNLYLHCHNRRRFIRRPFLDDEIPGEKLPYDVR
jgi:hypothetical protein